MSNSTFITSKLDGNVIDIDGTSKETKEPLAVHAKKTTDTGNQQWEFIPDPAASGFYFIKSKLDGSVIDVEDNSKADGAKLQVYPQKKTGTDNQLWEFIPDAKDPSFFFIKSKLDGHVMDIQGASTKSGADLIAHPQKTVGTDNQLWKADGDAFPAPTAVPTSLSFLNLGTGSGTTSGGSTECSYTVNLTINSDGNCRFWGSYTNRGDIPIFTAPNQSFGVSIVVHDMNGKGYAFSTGGNVPSAPQHGCTESWDTTHKVQAIANNWESIGRRKQASYGYHNDTSFVDFLSEIASAVESAISTVGTIASDVTTVVSVVAAVAA